MTVADMIGKHKITAVDDHYGRIQIGRILAGKDIFRKKKQFKSKHIGENTSDTRCKFDLIAKRQSFMKSPGPTRSKSQKRALSLMNSSTMSSIAAKKLRESRGSPNSKVIWHNKSLEKSSLKESSSKKGKSEVKLSRSMSVASSLVGKNNFIPKLMTTFSKKRSMIGLVEKPGADIISAKRNKVAIIPKGLISSVTSKKLQKLDPSLPSLSQVRLKRKKSKLQMAECELDKSSAVLDQKMADLKSKLELFFKAHELLKRQLATN